MAVSSSARRYAQAVFDIAREGGETEKWREDLRRMAEVFSVPELLAFVSSPRIRFDHKQRVIESQLTDASPKGRNLALLLVRRGRAQQAPDIARAFEEMVDAQKGVVPASVTTAVPLDPVDEQRIRAMLARQMGQELRLTLEVNPEIIGGLIARVGDRVLDGSTRTRLREMRERLRSSSLLEV